MLKDSQLREQYNVIIVAIKKGPAKMLYNPPGDTIIEPGDIFIALGHREQLDQMEALARG